MALIINQPLASPNFTSICRSPTSSQFFSSHPKFFDLSSKFKSFSLFSIPPPSPSSSSSSSSSSSLSPPSIFLPFLDEKEEDENEEEEEEEEEEDDDEDEEEEEENGGKDCPDDPIYRFFKSRNSTRDSVRESKLSLQKNRRTTWHLAETTDFLEEPKEGFEFDLGESKLGENGEVRTDESNPTSKIEGVTGEGIEIARSLGDDSKLGFEFELGDSKLSKNGELGCDESNPNCKIEGVVGEIIEIARNLGENSTLGEELVGFEGRVGERECIEVLGLMSEERLMRSCLYFYEWMGLQEPPLLTPRACSVVFPTLGRAGMGDKLVVLWRNLPVGQVFRDVRVYNAALSGLLFSGRYDDAWKVYEDMETNNILPDHVTCSIMITIMRKEGKSAKEAWDFFTKMNRKGIKWSLEVVGALIKSFCDEGLHKQALIIQGEMEKRGVSSNAIIYNTLMDAYCKSNHLEEAEALFAEMKTKDISPTSSTYNILMDAYCKRIQPEIVEKLLQEMQGAGLNPSVRSYTCLISAYGRQRKMSDMAADAFLRMKKAGIKPTSHSCTALIHAYSVSGWHEKAYKAFESMQREGLKPAIETYTTLLDAFRRAGDTKMLMSIWKSMIREKIEGTRVTFNILLDGFAKQGQYVEARDVICEFGKIGQHPTVMTYNMLMNAYARGGQQSKLPQLLKEMAALNLKPDSITYSTMIYAYVRVRDFKRAFLYHKQMVKTGQIPDAKSYEKMRSILDVKAATKNKKDRKAIMGIVNSKMGLLKAKKKGKKDEFWKNKKKSTRSLSVVTEGR